MSLASSFSAAQTASSLIDEPKLGGAVEYVRYILVSSTWLAGSAHPASQPGASAGTRDLIECDLGQVRQVHVKMAGVSSVGAARQRLMINVTDLVAHTQSRLQPSGENMKSK